MPTKVMMPAAGWAHRWVSGPQGQGHESVREVVPVHHEGAAVPARRSAAQRQRGQGRRHLPAHCCGAQQPVHPPSHKGAAAVCGPKSAQLVTCMHAWQALHN